MNDPNINKIIQFQIHIEMFSLLQDEDFKSKFIFYFLNFFNALFVKSDNTNSPEIAARS